MGLATRVSAVGIAVPAFVSNFALRIFRQVASAGTRGNTSLARQGAKTGAIFHSELPSVTASASPFSKRFYSKIAELIFSNIQYHPYWIGKPTTSPPIKTSGPTRLRAAVAIKRPLSIDKP